MPVIYIHLNLNSQVADYTNQLDLDDLHPERAQQGISLIIQTQRLMDPLPGAPQQRATLPVRVFRKLHSLD